MGNNDSRINSNSLQHNVDFISSGTAEEELKGVTAIAGAKPGTNLIMTNFRWGSQGNTVLVTGTFTKWINHIPLYRQRNIWTTTIELERGVYYYKFIVDDQWRFNPEDQTKPDEHGNINNYIDLTKYQEITLETEAQNMTQEVQMEEDQVDAPKKRPLISVEEFDVQAPKLPPQFQKCRFLDGKQQDVEDQKLNGNGPSSNLMHFNNLQTESMIKGLGKSQLIEIFDSPHSIEAPSHVVLNHVRLKQHQKFNVYSISHRFKSKYTTYKFFTSTKPFD